MNGCDGDPSLLFIIQLALHPVLPRSTNKILAKGVKQTYIDGPVTLYYIFFVTVSVVTPYETRSW